MISTEFWSGNSNERGNKIIKWMLEECESGNWIAQGFCEHDTEFMLSRQAIS
jgi:hypothetical protein